MCEMNQTPELSEARLAANRENAQKSTGPKTPEGKAKSSLNAVKCGLTGNTVLFANRRLKSPKTVTPHQPFSTSEPQLCLAQTEPRL